MCGIVATLGPHGKHILHLLKSIEYRGYDSSGCAWITREGKLFRERTTGDMMILPAPPADAVVAIAHTRWATHGRVSEMNSHPHVDSSGRFALVHNGIIDNTSEIAAFLGKDRLRTETDSEMIVELISDEFRVCEDVTVAVERACSKLVGTWACALLYEGTPDTLYAFCNGAPVLIRRQCEGWTAASDWHAFGDEDRGETFILSDGELAVLTPGSELGCKRVSAPVLTLSETRMIAPRSDDPHPYDTWMRREIEDQPEAVSRALGYGAYFRKKGRVLLEGLEPHAEKWKNVRRLLLVGCGSSLQACHYAAGVFRHHCPSLLNVEASDASGVESILMATREQDVGWVCVTQSGETREVLDAAKFLTRRRLPGICVTNTVGSGITRVCPSIYTHSGKENSVCATKSFSGQVVALSLIACWMRGDAQEDRAATPDESATDALVDSLQRLTFLASRAIHSCADPAERLAREMKDETSCLILGDGFARSIAREGALKLKEAGYVHAEALGASELKHGPLALIHDSSFVIMILLDDEHQRTMLNCAKEVTSRGGKVRIITNRRALAEPFDPDPIAIPRNAGDFAGLLAVFPLQLLALNVALLKGLNPDRPRNLAKSVTV